VTEALLRDKSVPPAVVPVFLVLFAATAPGRALADDITLTLNHGAAPGASLQSWSGGTSPYQLHRSSLPQGVVAPAHLLGTTNSGDPGLADAAQPLAGSAFFYAAVSGTCGDSILDLNETCDDGGTAPGDGCSAVCQIETAASLSITPGSDAYCSALVGTPTVPRTFQVRNQGQSTSGALSIGFVSGDTADFQILAPIAGDCTGAALPGGASCNVRVRFAPTTAGARGTTLRVSATPGGAPQSTLSGVGKWPLTIDVDGTGSVTRDGSPVCVGTCPETTGYDNGAMVDLAAATANGSNAFFRTWSGACTGSQHDCTVAMTQPRSVTATFSPMTNNLAFVSSTAIATTLGSVGAYDQQCNALATAAGINNSTGNAWTSWLSLPGSLAQSRIAPGIQGWVRLDGKPFATTLTSLLTSGTVYNPLRLDEHGVDVGTRLVMTSTSNAGSATADNCFTYTSNAASVFKTTGDAAGGSGGWSSQSVTSCSQTASLYCLMKTKTAVLTVTPESGRRIYLSGTFTPAVGASPDLRCSLDKPASIAGTAKAFVAKNGTTAASVVSAAQRYVRLDGTFIGTGADLAAGHGLASGMWQLGTGAYAGDGQLVWTGAATPTTAGTSASTCGNWTSTASTATAGRAASSDTAWWSAGTSSCASTQTRLYCVEQ
jgi:cysteine-rich repeat protein